MVLSLLLPRAEGSLLQQIFIPLPLPLKRGGAYQLLALALGRGGALSYSY